MAIVATGGDSKAFAPAPAGLHQGVCVDVVDMGILEVTFGGKTKKQHKVRLVWQIDEMRDDGKRFILQKRYTLSLHEKANLRKELESWRGRRFTDDELKGFDLEKLIGVNAFINVVHAENQGNTYANVASLVPLKKGMPAMAVQDYIRIKDRPKDGTEGETIGTSEIEDDIPF